MILRSFLTFYFQVWKKTFGENLRGFDLDPFDDSRILLRCVDSIIFLGDFSTTKSPSGNGKKFYVSGKKAVINYVQWNAKTRTSEIETTPDSEWKKVSISDANLSL